MKHILYKTTCAVTGMFYIGIHSTNNLNDGYLGSGKRLKASVKKYGKELHTREILSEVKTRDELLALEEAIVTRELLLDGQCLNLSIGGRAGIPEHRSTTRSESAKTVWARSGHREKMAPIMAQNAAIGWLDPVTRQKRIESISKSSKKTWASEDRRKAVSDKLKEYTGERASQFGTCWVTKDGATSKIKLDELPHYLEMGFTRGRK